MDFEINKVICSDFQAKLSQKQHLGLEFPDYVKIVISYNVKYRPSGWPLLVHARLIKLPVKSQEVLMKNNVYLHFTIQENETQLTSDETKNESDQTETVNTKSVYNKNCYISHLKEVGCLLSKISVSGGELLTLQNELLYVTAKSSINSQAGPGQAANNS